MTWREEAPRGKLDLVTTLDFRMTSTCTYSDIVLPAATWYEKHDISTTDMHPFVHSFNPAIAPPWETKTDFEAFRLIGEEFSRLAATHLGTRTDVMAAPLMHDTADELAQPGGRVLDWKRGECDPVPGATMPKLVTVERDYAAVAQKMAAIGPLLDTLGTTVKGITWKPAEAMDYLARHNGRVRGGVADGRPSLARDIHLAEAILALSGTTNGGSPCTAGRSWRSAPAMSLADLAEERADEQITFADTQVQPRAVITSPEWSGSETGGRRYSPFVVNVERLKPWHTLTGRMHFFLDHDWMQEYGETLPVYRPPLNYIRHFGEQGIRRGGPPRDHRALPDPALEVVDPLRVPGQPAHAAAVPRRPGDLDEPAGRGEDRGRATTTGSRPSTATAWSPAAPWSATGCPRARCSCTTPRTGT